MANGGIKLNQQVSVVMGSISDWETMKPAATILADFGIKFEKKLSQLIECQRRCFLLPNKQQTVE